MNAEFWDFIQQLVDSSEVTIDRPKGFIHQRFPGFSYPVDYGYLDGTSSKDGGGVDIFVGSLGQKKVIGVLATVDLFKKDTELKIVMDCTASEIQLINQLVNHEQMKAIYIENDE